MNKAKFISYLSDYLSLNNEQIANVSYEYDKHIYDELNLELNKVNYESSDSESTNKTEEYSRRA